jgi:hypothetical protein
MQLTLAMTTELLERDRAIGYMLDEASSKDLAEARALLRERKAVRRELEQRHVARNN